MKLHKLPDLTLALLLVGAALGAAFVLPVPAQAQTLATAGVPKPYPVRDFFSNPEKAYFRLSEDGRTLGFMQPVAVDGGPRRLNVFVQALKGSDHAGRVRLAYRSEGLNSIVLYRPDEKAAFKPIISTD